jgi:hypothetical protein
MMLSYANDRDDTLYLPNSTWTEGRNVLFSAALELEQLQGWRYLYYIFLDEDLRYTQGSPREFEGLLALYEPAVASPMWFDQGQKQTTTVRF